MPVPRLAPLGVRPVWLRYAVATATVVVAVVLRELLDPVWGPKLPLLTFYPAVMVAAWFGGLGPGLFATVASAAAAKYFWLAPVHSLTVSNVGDLIALVLFVGFGVLMSGLTEALHRARRQEKATADEREALLGRERAARADAERLAGMLRQVQLVTEMPFHEVSAAGIMRELLARIREALASDTATILLLSEDGADLIPVSSDGLREAVAEAVRIPLGSGAAGRIALSESGLIFRDLAEVEVLSPFLRDRVKSLVGVPLRVGDRVIGVIHVGSSVPHTFTEEDLKLLRLVADRVALVIDRARVHEAERAARRDAEDASRLKDEFLAMLSHELRSPLNAIAGWLNVLRAKPGDIALAGRTLETIERNARLLTRLVDDLLDVSRIVSGRLQMERQRVDVVPLVEAIVDTMRPAALEKGITLRSILHRGTGLLRGDPARLQQVADNLIANAIKFTPAGGVVEVRVHGGPSEVLVTVSDTGQGISPEFLPYVFERFRQADTGPARTHGGLGLGLAIVRHLVELHGGTVDAESPGEGQGARFTVRLPVLKDGQPLPG
jgi:hypothetical protein